jgi:hypothetical protein
MIYHLTPDDLQKAMNGDPADFVERSWRFFAEIHSRLQEACKVFGNSFTPSDMRTTITDCAQSVIRDYGGDPAWLPRLEVLFHCAVTDFAHDDTGASRYKQAFMELVDPIGFKTTEVLTVDPDKFCWN